MDLAYDHIQEENFKEQPKDEPGESEGAAKGQHERRASDLNKEFQDAYKAVAASPWGAKLGGLWGSVRKQV